MNYRLHTLDSLRGLAALAVVFGHCLRVFPEFGTRPYPGPVSWAGFVLKRTPLAVLVDGHVAVLIFFVLSGLVLSLPFQQGRMPSYGVFIGKRVARLYPPYLAAVVLGAVLSRLFADRLPRGDSVWLLTGNWAEPMDVSAVWDYGLMLGRRVTLNNPVWSLDYEMRMSLVLPVLLLPMCRLGGLGAALVGAGLLAASVVLGTAWLPDVLHAVGQTAAFGAMFLLGAWLGGRVEALQAVRLRAASLVLGLLAWAVFFLCWRDMLLAFGAALLIGAVLVPGPVARFCMTRPARFLGRISYSLYLVHVPVLLTMLAVLHGVLPTVFIVALAPAAGIGVAMLFYSAIERPCHRLARAIGSV